MLCELSHSPQIGQNGLGFGTSVKRIQETTKQLGHTHSKCGNGGKYKPNCAGFATLTLYISINFGMEYIPIR